ncbi:hypothetical protein N8564_01285, partial [Verrucomicrobiales bacterium]|nr:hypothetical protein [Verrucomicrobiales bacterium]
LGMNSSRIATAQLLVANRFIEPLSEWALIDWAEHTALPELLGTNITKRTKDRLKQLLKRKRAIRCPTGFVRDGTGSALGRCFYAAAWC